MMHIVTFGVCCASDIHVAWLQALHTALCCGQCFFWQSLPQYAVSLHPLQALEMTGMGASGDSLWRSLCARSDNRSLRNWTAWTSHTPGPQSAETASMM